MTWRPNPGPQTVAFNSAADIIGYGGAAGGGKTDLLLGLAGLKHRRSIIFRRIFKSVRGIIERSRDVYNREGAVHSRDSYNESLHLWRLKEGRTVELASMQYEEDKKKFQGQPYDLHGFDEVTEFNESQVRFVIGWNRSTWVDPVTQEPQRCQVVMTFNPPMDEQGQWVIKYFGPWLDPEHPNRAQDGELRWFTTDDAGDDLEVDEDELRWYVALGGAIREVPDGRAIKQTITTEDGETEERWVIPQRGFINDKGKLRACRSRTFFHASLEDNPPLAATGYDSIIDSMPEPIRSFLKGDFDAAKEIDPWQVIPALWVQLAQKRWRETERPDTPQTACGGDVAHGGKDKTVLAPRYGLWWDELKVWKGVETPTGQAAANVMWPHIEPGATVNVDAIGYGASCCERLQDLARAMGEDDEAATPPQVRAVNVGRKSHARDKSRKYGFKNLRSELYWKMRELLDPENGHEIALPPDQELLADLCAAKWTVVGVNIVVESKDDIKERIGRSPDKGDAVLLSLLEPVSGQEFY